VSQRIRKRIADAFGWTKTVAGLPRIGLTPVHFPVREGDQGKGGIGRTGIERGPTFAPFTSNHLASSD
jgi:hypothetical protein